MVKLSDEVINQILELSKQDLTQEEIANELDLSVGVVNKYINMYEQEPTPLETVPTYPMANPIAVTPTQQPNVQQPFKTVELQPAPPAKSANVIEQKKLEPVYQTQINEQPKLYPEVLEPEQWLRQFLEGYQLRDVFIQAQCSRVKRRNQLPTATDLMMDLKEGDSGQKNPLMIRDIAEDYDYAVNEYLKQKEVNTNRSMFRRQGIPLPSDAYGMNYTRQGIPLERYQQPDYYGQQPQYDPYAQYRDPYSMYPRWQGINLPPPTQHIQPTTNPYPTLEQELERLARIKELLGKTEEKSPIIERYERDLAENKTKLDKLIEEKQRELENELNSYRQQYQSERQRREEMESQVRKLEYQGSQKGLTETDLKFQELKDKQELEMRRLDEKAKTRETIAKAVSTGFSQVGQAIFRTAQEMGGGEQREMVGVSDGHHMWQAACPYCNAQITAPISAKTVICPSCGRQLNLSEEQDNLNPQPQPSYQMPPSSLSNPQSITPPLQQPFQQPYQQPTQKPSMEIIQVPETSKKSENIIATCPYCNKLMMIPDNAKLVACPHCNKRLEIKNKEPNGISSQAGFTVEQPLPPLEQHQTPPIYEQINYSTKQEPIHIKPIELYNNPIKPPEYPKENIPIIPEEEIPEEIFEEKKQIPLKEQSEQEYQEAIETKKETPETSKEEPMQTTTEQPKTYTCEFCGKIFENANRLQGHRLSHLRWKHTKKE